jgi:hypothetical protein
LLESAIIEFYSSNLIDGNGLMSGGLGAWQTKFETMSQLMPVSPTAPKPKQLPSCPESAGGKNAVARSPSQFALTPPAVSIADSRELEDNPEIY